MAIYDIAKKGRNILSYLGIKDTPDIRYPSEKHFRKSNIKKDVLGLLDSYYYTSGVHISNRTCTALAIVTESFEHHNCDYDLNNLLTTYDVSLDSFDRESHKIRVYSRNHYWRDSPEYWNISGNKI